MNRNDEAINQLLNRCYVMNATQLAELEFSLRSLGLTEMASIVRNQGNINAGGDYEQEYQAVVAGKFAVN